MMAMIIYDDETAPRKVGDIFREHCPGALRKEINRGVQDLLMRTMWALEPPDQKEIQYRGYEAIQNQWRTRCFLVDVHSWNFGLGYLA